MPNDERAAVEAYLAEHELESTLNDIINDIVKSRPFEPYLELGSRLSLLSPSANSVVSVLGVEIINGWGMPCLEVRIVTQRGTFVGSTSSGPYDEDAARYGGRGLANAVATVNEVLGDKLVGGDVTDQRAIDQLLQGDDDLPANVVLACSIACCKAGADHLRTRPFERIADLAETTPAIPMPCISVLNGGTSARTETKFFFEEIMVLPQGAESIGEAIETVSKLNRHLQVDLLVVGKRGAYQFNESPKNAMEYLTTAVENAEVSSLAFAIDASAPSYVVPKENNEDDENDGQTKSVEYETTKFGGSGATEVDLMATYVDLLKTFHISTLEDPFADDDYTASLSLKERLDLEALRAAGEDVGEQTDALLQLGPVGGDSTCLLQVAGDAVCSSAEDIEKHDSQKTLNTLCLTLRKGKTVTGCLDLAKKARTLGWGVIVSSDTEGGESDDSFVAHLAVGVRAGQFKAGGLLSYEHMAKYNELKRISDDDNAPPWIGTDFRVGSM